MKRYIIGLDEGTTSVRSLVYDVIDKKIITSSQLGFKQYYPHHGWVEQDAEEIWQCQKKTLDDVLSKIDINEVIGLGITNQRETVVAWDRSTGKPISKAIVWQCRRTEKLVEKIPALIKRKIKTKTGLIPNSYFSATKMQWILNNVTKSSKLLSQDRLCLGTIDSYLAYRLTGKFVTDTTNASRTMLFNINTLKWDDELLKYFNIPITALAEVVDSNANVGMCLDYPFPVCGIIGDQQSSLVGQACLKKGMAKATYGTGCFVLMNIGREVIKSKDMLCTVGYTINGKTTYALEGSVYSACNAIDWLKNNLGLYEDVVTTADMCKAVENNGNVYFVPAFSGLGAPYWDNDTSGTILGMTLATNKNHIVRACIESIGYNTYAVIKAMKNKNLNVKELHVDGGGSKNKFLLQFQADITQRTILKSAISESTAMGAVYMAGLSQKIFTTADIEKNYKVNGAFHPEISLSARNKLYLGWENAIKTVKFHGKVGQR